MIREAQAHAASLIEDHAIVGAATEQARSLVGGRPEHGAAQRAAADDYAREVMQRLEDQLEQWLETVREGLQSLPQPPKARGARKP